MPPSREWPQQEYAGEVALVVAYGTATDNVGFHYEKIDQLQCLSGPAAFTVDPRGGWYVVDRVNGLLKHFGEADSAQVVAEIGAFAPSRPPLEMWSVVASADGTAYVCTTDALVAISPLGSILWVLRPVGGAAAADVGTGLVLDRPDGRTAYSPDQILPDGGEASWTDVRFIKRGGGPPIAIGLGVDGAVHLSLKLSGGGAGGRVAGTVIRFDGDGVLLGTAPSCQQDAAGTYYGTWLAPDYSDSTPRKQVLAWDHTGSARQPIQVALPQTDDDTDAVYPGRWLVAPDGSLFGIGDYKRDASGVRHGKMVIKYSPEGAEVARFIIRPVRAGIMSCYCIGPDGAFWTWEDVGDKLGFVCYRPKAADAGAK